MKQMPEEGSKFQTVDAIYREIMEKTEKVGPSRYSSPLYGWPF